MSEETVFVAEQFNIFYWLYQLGRQLNLSFYLSRLKIMLSGNWDLKKDIIN